MTDFDSSIINTTYLGKNLFFNPENGVISLEDENEQDLDASNKLYIKYNHNIQIEIRYPNVNRLKLLSASVASLIGDHHSTPQASQPKIFGKYLKHLQVNVKPPEESLLKTSLCERILGLFPSLAFDPQANEYKVLVQGVVPRGPLSKQPSLKIGLL